MRILLIALIIAAAGVTLALTLGLSDTESPQDVVKRFIESPKPLDACDQWTRPRQTECIAWVAKNPHPSSVGISRVAIHGNRATLMANYAIAAGLGAPGGGRFSLAQQHGVWLITGAR